MSTIPDPYSRSTFRGKPLDNATIARLKQAEAKLGYDLTIMQGIGGAAASAGTHTEGRAVDLAPFDKARKVRVLRDLGFAAWYRPAIEGLWGAHIHAVLIFESRTNSRGIADSAVRQIASYDRGRDGLKGDGVDPNPYRPDPKVTFTLAQYRATFAPTPRPEPEPTRVSEARELLAKSLALSGQAKSLLLEVPEHRDQVHAQIEPLSQARRALRAVLDDLPGR